MYNNLCTLTETTTNKKKHETKIFFTKNFLTSSCFIHSFVGWIFIPFLKSTTKRKKRNNEKKKKKISETVLFDWKFNEAKMRKINRNQIPINSKSLADHMSFILTVEFVFCAHTKLFCIFDKDIIRIYHSQCDFRKSSLDKLIKSTFNYTDL